MTYVIHPAPIRVVTEAVQRLTTGPLEDGKAGTVSAATAAEGCCTGYDGLIQPVKDALGTFKDNAEGEINSMAQRAATAYAAATTATNAYVDANHRMTAAVSGRVRDAMSPLYLVPLAEIPPGAF